MRLILPAAMIAAMFACSSIPFGFGGSLNEVTLIQPGLSPVDGQPITMAAGSVLGVGVTWRSGAPPTLLLEGSSFRLSEGPDAIWTLHAVEPGEGLLLITWGDASITTLPLRSVEAEPLDVWAEVDSEAWWPWFEQHRELSDMVALPGARLRLRHGNTAASAAGDALAYVEDAWESDGARVLEELTPVPLQAGIEGDLQALSDAYDGVEIEVEPDVGEAWLGRGGLVSARVEVLPPGDVASLKLRIDDQDVGAAPLRLEAGNRDLLAWAVDPLDRFVVFPPDVPIRATVIEGPETLIRQVEVEGPSGLGLLVVCPGSGRVRLEMGPAVIEVDIEVAGRAFVCGDR